MTDVNEQTIVISDLLSFLACKVKLASKSKLLSILEKYYSVKDIAEAHKTFFASLQEAKISKYCNSYMNSDSLIAMYDCFQAIPSDELPVFVCKNLNNVPELDIIKVENDPICEEDEEEFDADAYGVEKTLREEQKTMKSQIADIAVVVKQLKDQLENISQQNNYQSKTKRKHSFTHYSSNKKLNSEPKLFRCKKKKKIYKKKDLKYLQSLIDEDEERIENDQSEKDDDSDNQDGISLMESELEEISEKKMPCEVIMKEEPEDLGFIYNRNDEKTGNEIYLVSPSKTQQLEKYFGDEEGSPSKTVTQKVLYIKNNEEQDVLEEENSIEITSSSDFFSNLEEDPLSRVGPLDSIITISKHIPSESIIIEKIEATTGEGFYYKCQRCEFICNEEKMILKHECNALSVDVRSRKPRRTNKYTGSNVWMCTICDTYVMDVVEFNEHMLAHYNIIHGEGNYECVLCTQKTDCVEDYKLHLLEHSWKVPYACDLCEYRTTKEIRMRNHTLKHLECKGPNHYECLMCRKICGTRNALEKHKQRHKKNYEFKCEICGLTFRHRSALSQHTINHTKERIHVCQICNYRYESQHSLDVHFKVHFKEELYPCHICDQKFKSKNTYRNHVLSMHEGLKPFKCDLCDEAFIFKHTMLMHRKSHGSQLYVCVYCNKKFKSPHYLKVHCAAKHEGKSPFKCSSCDFNSHSRANLKKHMSEHNESLNLSLMSCKNCNYATVYSTEMEKHNRTHHHSNLYNDSKMVILMEAPQ